MTMEAMTREEVTGCPPKSPMGPMVTVEPGSIAESVVVGVITIVAIWGSKDAGNGRDIRSSRQRSSRNRRNHSSLRPLPQAIAGGRDFAGNAP
jgi:hypothetical protein